MGSVIILLMVEITQIKAKTTDIIGQNCPIILGSFLPKNGFYWFDRDRKNTILKQIAREMAENLDKYRNLRKSLQLCVFCQKRHSLLKSRILGAF